MAAQPYDPAQTAEALQSSLESLETLLRAVPERWLVQPVIQGHTWGVSMNLAHLAVYERLLAAPVLEEMLEGRDGRAAAPSGDERWFERETLALSGRPVPEIWGQLKDARARQVRVVGGFEEAAFNTPLTSLWGTPQPAGWVAWKTVQHTWEHGTPVMQTALFAPR